MGTEILWLCSFDSAYTGKGNAQTFREKVQAEFGADVKLVRMTDVLTPELVSQKLFDAIRRYQLCLLDWTQWSANLFFEFGVRLAANPLAPVCLISESPEPLWMPKQRAPRRDKERFEAQSDQITWLKWAFAAIPYRVGDAWNAREIKQRAQSMRSALDSRSSEIPPTYGVFPFDFIYNLIASEIQSEEELNLKTPIEILKDATARLVGEANTRILGIPAIYADKNANLNKSIRRSALEYAVAAWRYANGELKLVENPSEAEAMETRNLANRVTKMLELWDDNDERKKRLLDEIKREEKPLS